MKHTLTILMLFFLSFGYSQINVGGTPISWTVDFEDEENVPIVEMPELDLLRLSKEDQEEELNGLPPRFGFRHNVNLNLQNSGIWNGLLNGKKIWRLEISCIDALSINLLFDKFWIPESGKLYIYNSDKSHVIGGFTSLNNKGSKDEIRGFGTGLVYGNKIILEYEQNIEDDTAELSIGGVVQGYRLIKKIWEDNIELRDFGDSGSCNVNINCSPEGDDWQDEKTGVALVIVDGVRWCSGSLINNSCNDGTLYFLTADHCIGALDAEGSTNADNYTFVWNYEAPGCTNPSSQPTLFTTNGATLIANDAGPDFALFELDESPYSLNPQQEVMFNGWSKIINPLPNNVVAISHPSGDIKKFAKENDAVEISPWSGGGVNDHIKVNDWDSGTTEPISSGSPLFNSSGLIIGQLHGGFAACGNNLEDLYGMFNYSWDTNSNTKRQLKNWLGACGDVTELEGGYLDQCHPNVFVDFPLTEDKIIQASDWIKGSDNIGSSANVEFKAGEIVELLPGFQAIAGCEFKAHIDPCEPKVFPIGLNKNSVETVFKSSIGQDFFVLKVYPNPASDILNVNLKSNDMGIIQLYVSNTFGQLFGRFEYELRNKTSIVASLDISELLPGVYYLTSIRGNYKESIKFIKI